MQTSLKFDKRVRTIARKNRRLAQGHRSYIDETGIIRKKAHRAMRIDLPLKGLVMMMLGFVLFKAVVVASIGDAAYGQRLDLLTSGSLFERAGAWALQIDPLTMAISGVLTPLF